MAGYRHLVDGDRRTRTERDAGVFVIEGERSVAQMLDLRWPMRSVLLSERRAARRADLVEAAEAAGAEVLVAAQDLFDGIAGYPVHRGVLALAERPAERHPAQILAGCDLVLVIEGVNDYENLGSLFRNAAAFGVGAVLLDRRTADPLYRRCVRVSVGHVLRVPFARVPDWPAGLSRLREAGLTLVALSPAGAVTVEEVAAAGAARRRAGAGSAASGVALMVGAEGDGLSEEALGAADMVARISMAGGVDSLNVATAAAIALHRFRSG